MSKGRTNYFWISLFFVHLFFLVWQIQHEQWLLVDSHDYIWAAKNLNSSGTLFCADFTEQPVYQGNYTRRPPVYPAVLALIRNLSSGFLLPALLQMGFSLLGFFFFLKIFQLLYPRKDLPVWLLIFACLYPAQYIYANLIMAESIFQVLLMASVYFFFKGLKGKSYKAFIQHSISFILAVLTKPVLYLLIPIHFCFIGFHAWKSKKPKLWLAALIPVVIMSMYLNRNYQQTDYVHVSSVQNINLFQFPVSYIIARQYEPAEADRMIDEILTDARSQGSFREEQQFLSKANKEILWEYPGTFIQLHLRGMLNFFLDPGRFDVYHFFSVESREGEGLMATFGKDGYSGIWKYLKQQPMLVLALLAVVLFLNLLKFMAFVSFPFAKSISRTHKYILIGIVLYIAGITGTMGASRFAMPCFYFLLLMLPAAWEGLKATYLRIKSQ